MTPWLVRHNSGALDGATESYGNAAFGTGDGVVFSTYGDNDVSAVTKLDAEGNTVWQFVDPTFGNGYAKPDSAGNIYYLSGASLTKISAAGVVLWTKWTSTYNTVDSSLTVLSGENGTIVSQLASAGVLRATKYSSAGLMVWEKQYTATADETIKAQIFCEDGSGNLLVVSQDATGEDHIKITTFTSTFIAPASISIAVSGSDAAALHYKFIRLTGGDLVVLYLLDNSTTERQIARITPSGTVVWSKVLTDSVASFNGVTLNLFALGTGFVITMRNDANGPLCLRFDDDGALTWTRSIRNPESGYEGGFEGWGVSETNDGSLLVTADIYDADWLIVPMLIKLRGDGTPLGEFGNSTVDISTHTTASVATGATITAGASTVGTVATTAGTVTTPASVLSASSYPLLRYTHDLLQTKQAAGSRKTQFGTPNSPFVQAGAASGARNTLFGTASSFSFPASGATICLAAGTKTTKFGLAVDNSSIITVATGTRVTHFGTGQGLASYAATGYRGSHFGAPNGAVLTYAVGSRNTAFGTPAGLVAGAASGSRNTRYGTALSEWGNTGAATGYRGTHFGTPGSLSVFRATGSYHTRYGTPRVVRSIPC